MIERHWIGVTHKDRAEAYIRHLREHLFPRLRHLNGFAGASILHRDVGDGTEFRIITRWESMDVIRAFAGDDISVAVVHADAQALMVRYDDFVTHYQSEE